MVVLGTITASYNLIRPRSYFYGMICLLKFRKSPKFLFSYCTARVGRNPFNYVEFPEEKAAQQSELLCNQEIFCESCKAVL